MSVFDPGNLISNLATATLAQSQFMPISETDGTMKKATIAAVNAFLKTF